MAPPKNYLEALEYIDASTEHDVANERRNVYQFMQHYGHPAVIKHVMNSDDVVTGAANWDNTYDDVYGQGLPVGEDLGMGAGFDDGGLTYVVLGDSEIDRDSPNRPGAVQTFTPNGVAPWVPQIHNGDLLILVTMNIVGGNVEITGTGDRFIMETINPVLVRGLTMEPDRRVDWDYPESLDTLVCQNFVAKRIPRTDSAYQVSIS